MFDTFFDSLGGLRAIASEPIPVMVELLLIGLSVNWCAGVLQGTRGTRPLRGVLTVLVVATLAVNIIAAQFGWPRLELLYRFFVLGLVFIALVAFQPELRRAVIRAGDVGFLRRGTRQSKVITALVKSARYLSKNRYGGLVAIQRAVDLSGWAEKGTLLNAEVSANLLNTIFFPNSPLHDLGVVIAGNRAVAANCQFPVAESDEVGTALGSRHLAALGMSYESDALVLVVSEETGTISLADNGKLTRFLSLDDLADELTARLSGVPVTSTPESKERRPLARRAWRVLRRLMVVVPLTLAIWIVANQWTQTESAPVAVQLDVRINDPQRIVDVAEPQGAIFQVTFRGAAREVDALRDYTTANPLRVDWVAEDYRLGANEVNQRSAVELINSLPKIRARGLSVADVSPGSLNFRVQELVTVSLPVSADTGTARVENLRIEPAEVQVTLRRGDLEELPPTDRVLVLPLSEQLSRAVPGQAITLPGVQVPERIRGKALVNRQPRQVDLSLHIVGQRATRRLSRVPVEYSAIPEMLDGYQVVRADPQEWLIEIEVAGDESVVNALQPRDVRAYVTITSDLLTPNPVLRRVQFDVPDGVTVLGERSVQLHLVPREDHTP
ncbi:MAG: diadenylate cyclase [Phycisphaerae bacterium]|jgi:diadenylate cyclase